MRDLFACESFSQGTLANFKADCSRRRQPVEVVIRQLASAEPVMGFDETGVRAIPICASGHIRSPAPGTIDIVNRRTVAIGKERSNEGIMIATHS